mgnify:CR=1 FL=1
MTLPGKTSNAIKRSWLHRLQSWVQKPIEQKIWGLGGRMTALSYLLWVRSHRYDFDGIIHPHELLAEPNSSVAHSTHYLVSDVYSLKLLLDEALSERDSFEVFLDIGCGKGMPSLYAQSHYAFKESIGMDFSEKLIEIAQSNLRKSGRSDVRFIQADASSFKIAPQSSVVYLHNPFGPELLKTFLENNLEHFKMHSSVIAYAFDVHRNVLNELGFEVLYRSQRFAHSLWQVSDTRFEDSP